MTDATNATDQGADLERRYTVLYLGYASNLSPRTMRQRCPNALPVGLARLDNWRWHINSTNFANIVPSPGDIVYGNLFFLTARDEAALDASEGVPWLYEKHPVHVTRLDANGGNLGECTATAYVDVQRLEDGTIEPDYVVWCNKAIEDGIACGVPKEYVDKYMRPFVPEQKHNEIQMVRTMMAPAPGHMKKEEDFLVQMRTKGPGKDRSDWILPESDYSAGAQLYDRP